MGRTMFGTSPYLLGRFAPVTRELTVERLPVTGRLPEELDGRFVQIGPNPLRPNRLAPYHWLLGDGMVHGVRLGGGQAQWYRNRWIRTRHISRLLGEQPVPHGPHRMIHDNANTNVVRFAGMTLALAEAGCLPALLSDDLATVGYTDLPGADGRGLTHGFSAHPKQDPETGELHAVTYHPTSHDVRYVVVGADGGLAHTARIPMPGHTPVMHDMALTGHHVVLYDLPVHIALTEAVRGRMPMRWHHRAQARIGVLPVRGTAEQVRWFPVEPCYVFHTVGAFEDGQRVVVDAVRYERSFAEDHELGFECDPALWRWTLDLVTGAVREEQLADHFVEFPQTDPRRTGRPHRWAHFMAADRIPPGGDRMPPWTRLLRTDLHTGATETQRFGGGSGGGARPGEGVFVPRGPDAPEGDGWILCYVFRPETGLSEIAVLDSTDFAGDPVAVVHLPVRMPAGFHSSWLPAGPDRT
jgi:carotenoid cleavage dioxygenase-like enzyme